jgi:hypothetical protein
MFSDASRTVHIAAWEYAHAADVGTRRFVANWGKEDAEHYSDPTRKEYDRTATVAAAIAELAVAKYLNRYWHGHVWHASEHDLYNLLPDVGHSTEVRRIRVSQGLPIREKQNNIQGLIVWAAFPVPPEFRVVEILGWIPQTVGWRDGVWSNYEKEDPKNRTKLFPLNRLQAPTTKSTAELVRQLENPAVLV